MAGAPDPSKPYSYYLGAGASVPTAKPITEDYAENNVKGESLPDSIVRRAKRLVANSAMSPIAPQLTGTNAGVPGTIFHPPPNTYYLPQLEGKLNAGGWTDSKGNVVVANSTHAAQTAAHETYHARQVPTGGMPEEPYNLWSPDTMARNTLATNMQKISPETGKRGAMWGVDPNSSAEEQIANLHGYEGGLPAGTPITKSPVADQLFANSNGSTKNAKDYYFTKSSLPHQGIWEGQSPAPSAASIIKQDIARLMVKFGLNTANRE